MAYTNTQRSRNRTATTVLVAGLHLAVGYALVTGLGVSFIPKKEIITEGFPIPAPTPTPTPKPKGPKLPERNPLDPQIDVFDPPIPMPQPTFTVTPGPTPTGEGTEIAVVTFPTPSPTPSPSLPRFTPKVATPAGDPLRWVSPNDYPQSDLRLEHEGTTRFRLSIDASGRVSDCAVTTTSGWPGLDAVTCARIKARARFNPATDSDGAKVAGTYNSSVKWQIPKE